MFSVSGALGQFCPPAPVMVTFLNGFRSSARYCPNFYLLPESFSADAESKKQQNQAGPLHINYMEVEKNKVPVVNQYEMGAVREILFLPQPGKIILRISYLYVLSDGIPKRLSNSLHLMPGRISLITKPFMMAPFLASPGFPPNSCSSGWD